MPANLDRPLSELPPNDSKPEAGLSERTILVFFDDPLARTMVRLELRGLGFNVLTPMTCLEAAQLYKEHRNRIVGVMLDGPSAGSEPPTALMALKRIDPHIHAYLVMNNRDALDRVDFRKLGTNRVVAIPFDVRQLADRFTATARHLVRESDGWKSIAEPL